MSKKAQGIIHFGMPKTGTSSIQATFARLQMADVHYWNWVDTNHGSLVACAIGDTRHPFLGRIKGRNWQDQFSSANRALSDVLSTSAPPRLMMSAERIYTLDPGQKLALKEYLDTYCDDYLLVGYIREPFSYLSSAFQQNLKTGLSSFDLGRAWPNYREKISALDSVFGRERVLLRPFERGVLKNGDVVTDFADVIGVDLDPSAIMKTNESMKLEAAALLFTERLLGDGFHRLAPVIATQSNRRLVERLSSVGTTPFGVGEEILRPIFEKHADDLAWIEQRMGHTFDRAAGAKMEAVVSKAGLLNTALESSGVLRDLVAGLVSQVRIETPEDVARVLGHCLSHGSFSQKNDKTERKNKNAPRH